MTGPGGIRARHAFRAVLAVLLLALLWRAADGPRALESLAAADLRWLAAVLLALTLQTFLSAARWKLTAAQFGIRVPAARAIGEYYLSQVLNQSLPGGVLGDAGRAMRSRGQAGLAAAGQAVVFERLAGQIALFLTLAVAFAATLAVPGGLDWPGWLAAPVALFLAAGFGLPIVARVSRGLPGRPGQWVRNAGDALRNALTGRHVLPAQIVLSLGTTLCNLAAFAFCARAVGVDLGPGAVAALVPLILFTMLIPVTVSGWGFREGAAAALIPVAGVAASDGLAASVAFGLVFLAASLPGVLFIRPAPRAGAPDTGHAA